MVPPNGQHDREQRQNKGGKWNEPPLMGAHRDKPDGHASSQDKPFPHVVSHGPQTFMSLRVPDAEDLDSAEEHPDDKNMRQDIPEKCAHAAWSCGAR